MRDTIFEQFLLFEFRGGNDSSGVIPKPIAYRTVPESFHLNISVDWPVHSHGLNYIRDSIFAAEETYGRTEQIVQSVKMNEIEPPKR